jgi:SAM-dependent methyltransferase
MKISSARFDRRFVASFSVLALAMAASAPSRAAQWAEGKDVPFVPTPPKVVEAMLKMAKVTSDDFVIDLGCGDGRIVIAAAKEFKARGRGVDFNPKRVQEANANARQAGVRGRVQFVQGDFFEADIRDATVVTLYLLSSVNLKLRPKLLKELRVGSRIVSHGFDMGDWKPDRTEEEDGRIIRLWTVTGEAKAAYGGEPPPTRAGP